MALSPEVRTSDFRDSIKKYFIDSLETTKSIKTFFNWIDDVPVNASGVKLNSWIIIDFGDLTLGTMASCSVGLNLFTRKDYEGDTMATLCDTVLDYIVDESAANGLHTIPYYNTSDSPWVLVGGIVPLIDRIFEDTPAKDSTKIKTIHLLCKWGSK